jgi:hypothetical protein
MAGVAATASVYNAVYYAFDWRHAGRFQFEPTKSGAQRLLLGALDYIDQFRGILPVDLSAFDAYQSGRQAVSVEWKTASEKQIAAMEIERAEVRRTETGVVDGSFEVIDRQSPQGTATRGGSYRTVDATVQAGQEYRYRLVTVGIDGSRTVEAEKLVKISAEGTEGMQLTVQPNPVRTSGSISYRLPVGVSASVVLYDASGRQVSLLSRVATGEGNVELPVGELPSGMYTVQLKTATGAMLSATVTVQK